jgi:hypothetical protein
MYKTIYYTSRDFDGTTIVQALPPSVMATVVEEWTVMETKEVPNRSGSSKTIKYPVYHVVLLVDHKAMVAIRSNYIKRFDVHRNVFPHSLYEQANKLFVKVNPEERVVIDRVIKAFCKAVRIGEPFVAEDERGFCFVEFEKADFLPQLVGLLRGYMTQEGARIDYAKSRKQ